MKLSNFLVIAAIVFAAGCKAVEFVGNSSAPKHEVTVYLAEMKEFNLKAEYLDTSEEKKKGYQDRREPRPGEALVFKLDPTQSTPFWMRHVNFPLDILFVKDNRIVDIKTMQTCPANANRCEYFQSFTPPDHAIELKAGEAKRLDLRKGDAVQLQFR